MSSAVSFTATLVLVQPRQQRLTVRVVETGELRTLEGFFAPEQSALLDAITRDLTVRSDAVVLICSTNKARTCLYDIARDDEKFACAQCGDLVEASFDGKVCDDCRDEAMFAAEAAHGGDRDGVGEFDTEAERRDH